MGKGRRGGEGVKREGGSLSEEDDQQKRRKKRKYGPNIGRHKIAILSSEPISPLAGNTISLLSFLRSVRMID